MPRLAETETVDISSADRDCLDAGMENEEARHPFEKTMLTHSTCGTAGGALSAREGPRHLAVSDNQPRDNVLGPQLRARVGVMNVRRRGQFLPREKSFHDGNRSAALCDGVIATLASTRRFFFPSFSLENRPHHGSELTSRRLLIRNKEAVRSDGSAAKHRASLARWITRAAVMFWCAGVSPARRH